MPNFLIPQNPDFIDKWVAEAAATRRVVRISARSPWQGYVPDLDPHQSPPTGAIEVTGLVARPDPNSNGEVLMPDAGFARVDSANLPLADVGGSHRNVTMLAQFNRTTSVGADSSGEYGPVLVALVGGETGTGGSTTFWRLLQAGTWEEVPWSIAGTDPPIGHIPSADREFLSDWAEFPAGAPGRGAYNGNIDEPVFVWCNLNDRVMVYPIDDGVTGIEDSAFETLTDRFGADFKAATVEHFGGRLYFGNTIENGTHHRQRIRRTALFTADPLETSPGAGVKDIRDFSGDLLRLEKLGDLMAAYFTDGVAFIRVTDVATSPDRVQLLREKRGLLSTHSVVSVGSQEHFGIYDDGWFFLDPSGRWTEAGLVEIDGVQTPKWKETFYNLLDVEKRHRTVVSYDGRFVRIAFTANGQTDNQEVWIFDPRGNRVFRDTYPVVCWGEMERTLAAAEIWSGQTETWSQISGTWASLAAQFGLKATHHGTTGGHVLSHNYDGISQFDGANDVNPSFSYTFMLSAIGDPTKFKRALKLWIEQVHSASPAVTIRVSGDSTEGFEEGSVDLSSVGIPGDVNTVFRTFNFTAANLQFKVSGTSPVRMRSIMADVDITGSEERVG